MSTGIGAHHLDEEKGVHLWCYHRRVKCSRVRKDVGKKVRRDDGKILRRRGLGFVWGRNQFDWTMSGQADRVEVRFWSTKEDQLQDGTAITRARMGSPLPL